MRFAATAITVLAVAAGCTHHRPLAEVHTLDGDAVVVEFPNGVVTTGYAIDSGNETTIATHFGRVPAAQLRSVTRRSHLRGLVDGLGLGVLAGVGAGVALGFAGGDDECTPDGHEDCYYANTAGENALLGGIVLGTLGGVLGAAIGLVRGSKYVYESAGGEIRVTPNGPPGAYVGASLHF